MVLTALPSESAKSLLAETLHDIALADHDYDRRYDLIIDAIFLSRLVGYKVGFRFDPSNPGWPVVVIELPTGQVAWHMPEHPNIWDGHTTEEKFERIEAYRTQVANRKGVTV